MARVRLVRQKGGREEPATERFSRNPAARTWWIRAAQKPHPHTMMCEVTLRLVDVADREATMNACGAGRGEVTGA